MYAGPTIDSVYFLTKFLDGVHFLATKNPILPIKYRLQYKYRSYKSVFLGNKRENFVKKISFLIDKKLTEYIMNTRARL